MIIGGSGSEKEEQDDIDKIYLYAKYLSKLKYEFLIKKCKDAGTKHLNDPEWFIECSSTMDGVYEDTDECNQSREGKLCLRTWL